MTKTKIRRKPRRNELSKHSSCVRGGRALYQLTKSLPQTSSCHIGHIVGQASLLRGVEIIPTDIDILLKLYSNDGMQRFNVTPMKGATLHSLASAISAEIKRSKRFRLLQKENREMAELKSPKPIDKPELVPIYHQLLQFVGIGDDGRKRIDAPYAKLAHQLGLGEKEALRIFGQFKSRHILVKDVVSSEGRNIKKGLIFFFQETRIEVPEAPVPTELPTAAVCISVPREDSITVVQALESFWASCGDQLEKVKQEVRDIASKIADLQNEQEKKIGSIQTLEREINKIESLIGRFQRPD